MITIKRTYDTGSMKFDSLEEFELVIQSISAFTAYADFYRTYRLSGQIVDSYSFWKTSASDSLEGSVVVERYVVFASQSDYDAFNTDVAHLTAARDAALASLGWTVTKVIIVD